jgi:hypothetical protein
MEARRGHPKLDRTCCFRCHSCGSNLAYMARPKIASPQIAATSLVRQKRMRSLSAGGLRAHDMGQAIRRLERDKSGCTSVCPYRTARAGFARVAHSFKSRSRRVIYTQLRRISKAAARVMLKATEECDAYCRFCCHWYAECSPY